MIFKLCSTRGALIALLFVALLGHAQAASIAEWEGCSSIPVDVDRLACYDQASGKSYPETASEPPVATEFEVLAIAQEAEPAPAELTNPDMLSALSRHWELDDEAKQGAFLFRPHRPNYFLPVKYSNSPNNNPSEVGAITPGGSIDPVETELQLSFKIKAIEGVLGHGNADLWLGYTITSFWQAFNAESSSPFRETNYEPEVFLTYRTDYSFAGFHGRFINLGFSHQSNGSGEARSRSWNRIYAQVGLERDNFSLLIRPWYRIPEVASDDDNPDINDYMGYGDLQMFYRHGRNAYSVLVRNNLDSSKNRGAFQINWSFPLYARLKGYVKYFNGYGESMSDYNHSQQSFGFGLSLTEGM